MSPIVTTSPPRSGDDQDAGYKGRRATQGHPASVDPARSLAAYSLDQARCAMKPVLLGRPIIVAGLAVIRLSRQRQHPLPEARPRTTTVHELLAEQSLVGRMVEVTGQLPGLFRRPRWQGFAARSRGAIGNWRMGARRSGSPARCLMAAPRRSRRQSASVITAYVAQDTLQAFGGAPAEPRRYSVR